MALKVINVDDELIGIKSIEKIIVDPGNLCFASG